MQEITLIFHLKLKPLPNNKDSGYIFYHASGGIKITSFVKGKYLFFGVPECNDLGIPKSNKLADHVKIPINFFDKPVMLSFLYSYENNKTTLSIYIGTKKAVEKIFLIPICTSGLMLNETYTLGSDVYQKNYGYFDLYQSLIYLRLLTNDELSKMENYFLQKPPKSYLEFNGNAFFYKDLISNSLVQRNPKFQPKRIEVE